MSKPPWCRLYSEVLSDRKIKYICRRTQQPKVVILGAWTTFLALANDSPRRGVLLLTEAISYTEADLAGEMGIDTDQACDIIGAFVELGLLTVEDDVYYVTNFNKRNFTSDNSTERVRQWRARQDAQEDDEESPNDYGKGNGDETLQERCSNSGVTPPDSDADTDSNADSEAEGADAPPTPPPKRKRKARKQPTPTQQASRAMFAALADACQIDLALLTGAQRGQLNQTEARLRKEGITPHDLGAFTSWWYEHDWRGQKKQPPRPAQVREEWGKFTKHREGGQHGTVELATGLGERA